MAQAQTATKILNNTAAERTLSLSTQFAKKDNKAGISSEQLSTSANWSNPVTDRVSTQFGLTYSKSDVRNTGTGLNNTNQSLGGNLGVSVRVGPAYTTVYGSAFYNNIDASFASGGAAVLASKDNSLGYAIGISQPIPLGANTMSTFSISYAAVPSEGTKVTSLNSVVYHRLSDDWALTGGLLSQWSNQPLTLSGAKKSNTVNFGAAYKISERVNIGATASSRLGTSDREITAGVTVQIALKGAGQ